MNERRGLGGGHGDGNGVQESHVGGGQGEKGNQHGQGLASIEVGGPRLSLYLVGVRVGYTGFARYQQNGKRSLLILHLIEG